jgi:hypothetical protein
MVRGRIFVAAPDRVDFGTGGDVAVLVVGLTGDRLVDEHLVSSLPRVMPT